MHTQPMVKVWDPLVRVAHWSLATAFFVAYLTEDDLITVHVWAGYTVLGLVLLRIVWGVIGPRHARFTDFVVGPRRAWAYLGAVLRWRARRYLGHNPAGGAMIVLLLLGLLATTFTGLGVYGAEDNAGPLAGWLGNSSAAAEDLWEEIHEWSANFTLALVFLHVLGVLAESFMHRENLIRAMINGYKRTEPKS